MNKTTSDIEQSDEDLLNKWTVLLGPFGSLVLAKVLTPWLAPPLVVGTMSIAFALFIYLTSRRPRPPFGRYAFHSLLLTLYVVGLFYLASSILTPRIGPILAWGPLVALFSFSLYWLPDTLDSFRGKSASSLSRHTATSVGFGAIVALMAYLRPEYFTK